DHASAGLTVRLVRTGVAGQLQERGILVQQQVETLPGEQPVPRVVSLDRPLTARRQDLVTQLGERRERVQRRRPVALELVARRVETRVEHTHPSVLPIRRGPAPGGPAYACPISSHS